MTDKERLDAIKGRAMFNQLAKRTGEITHSLFTLDADDYDWLIEQAERVQDLKIMLKVLGERNQCYREALLDVRETLNTSLSMDVESYESVEIIDKALEGEE